MKKSRALELVVSNRSSRRPPGSGVMEAVRPKPKLERFDAEKVRRLRAMLDRGELAIDVNLIARRIAGDD